MRPSIRQSVSRHPSRASCVIFVTFHASVTCSLRMVAFCTVELRHRSEVTDTSCRVKSLVVVHDALGWVERMTCRAAFESWLQQVRLVIEFCERRVAHRHARVAVPIDEQLLRTCLIDTVARHTLTGSGTRRQHLTKWPAAFREHRGRITAKQFQPGVQKCGSVPLGLDHQFVGLVVAVPGAAGTS